MVTKKAPPKSFPMRPPGSKDKGKPGKKPTKY